MCKKWAEKSTYGNHVHKLWIKAPFKTWKKVTENNESMKSLEVTKMPLSLIASDIMLTYNHIGMVLKHVLIFPPLSPKISKIKPCTSFPVLYICGYVCTYICVGIHINAKVSNRKELILQGRQIQHQVCFS